MEAMGMIRELANSKAAWEKGEQAEIPFELEIDTTNWYTVQKALNRISRDHGVEAAQAAADYAKRLTGHTWSVIDYTADIPF